MSRTTREKSPEKGPDEEEARFERLVAIHRRLAALAVESRKLVSESGLSRRQLAERMGLSSPSLLRRILESSTHNATTETLAKLAWACGRDLELRFVKIAAPTSDPLRIGKGPKGREEEIRSRLETLGTGPDLQTLEELREDVRYLLGQVGELMEQGREVVSELRNNADRCRSAGQRPENGSQLLDQGAAAAYAWAAERLCRILPPSSASG